MIKDVRFCAWGVLLSLLLIFGSGTMGGSFLTLPTSTSAADLAVHYRQYHVGILWFAVIQTAAALLWLMLAAAIAAAMMRMQPRSLVLAFIALLSLLLQIMTPFIGSVFFAAAALLPTVSPDVTLSLHTMGKMLLFGSMHAFAGGIVVAIAIFRDRSSLLPKWYAWVNVAYAIIPQFNVLTLFIDAGPLGPDGFVGQIVPLILVAVYIITTTVALLGIKPEQWDAGS